jgi:tetratricopeptide (TPR) repeat protein
MNSNSLTTWKIVGLISTLVIILSMPLYLLMENQRFAGSGDSQLSTQATFAGSHQCRSCHKQEYDKWQQSHHRMAMAKVTAETVLGNFNNSEFEHYGVTTRFFMKDNGYFVHTLGPEGVLGEFPVTHTFGWYPLQQYLVPFPGGRLQCLPIAWNVEKKEWYHLYPDTPPDPADWLYWTNQAQNWNGMCAECHSTDLKKNYDMTADSYQTTWSEISVGCEACHGPGSNHVRWAELPEMGRPVIENDALAVRTSNLTSQQQIELCAPCHSRRMSLGDNIHRHADFLDYGIPQLLSPGMYFADGQILEEVYVYGSFIQSKMYARDVRCSDCHDVHSGLRIREGNDLCLQCHKQAVYDTKDHHFHKQKGEPGEPVKTPDGKVLFDVGTGASCEQCHMPGREYMGTDYRPDHSFRIPRPDLTQQMGVPNACNRCHVDKTASWSMEKLSIWYGQKNRPHYGTVLNAGRLRPGEVQKDLIRLAEDRLYPSIVRATALSLLASSPSEESRSALVRALSDETSLMRHTAVQNLYADDSIEQVNRLAPLLYDPVKAVRGETARQLVTTSTDSMTPDLRNQFEKALSEYQLAMERMADFASSRHNLGNLSAEQGNTESAIQHYKKAIEIDQEFFPAKVNLAMLYNRQGKNQLAEKLFMDVVTAYPDQFEATYSLGLLLAEMKKYEQAAVYLRQAAKGLPKRARIRYNLGILLQQIDNDGEAESALQGALAIEPNNLEYLYAMAVFYLQRQRLDEAEHIAERMRGNPTTRSAGQQILETIKHQRRTKGNG